MTEHPDRIPELIAQVAAAYFSNCQVPVGEIPTVMRNIADGLASPSGAAAASEAAAQEPAEETAPRKATPAAVRKSIRDDGLVSFEDGKSYKMLKRHLSLRSLTPQQYREKWGLPKDYPMTAPAYSSQRSALAKKIGLGGAINRSGAAGPKSRRRRSARGAARTTEA